MRTLPKWDPDSMSDGCSALPIGPLAVRRRFNRWVFKRWPGTRKWCEAHDRGYRLGGPKWLRVMLDIKMLGGWEEEGVPEWVLELTFRAIRFGGGPRWRTPGVSWANGGEFYRYDEQPAREE